MLGEAFALLAALTFALSIVYSRRFMVPTHFAADTSAVAPEVGVLVSMISNVVVFGTLASWEAARGRLALLTPSSVALFMLGGVTGTFVGRNLAYQSVLRIGPSRSTAIRLSNTFFAVFIGLLLLHELPRLVQLIGALLITLGLWLVIGSGNRQQALIDSFGVLAAMGAAMAFALGDSVRRAALGISPSPIFGAAIGASVALIVQGTWLRVQPRRIPLRGLWRVDVVVSALCNTAAILLLFLALQRTAVANVSALYNLQVLFVILLSRWLLPADEEIGRRSALGSVICLLGSLAVLLG